MYNGNRNVTVDDFDKKLGSCGCKSSQEPNSSRFVGITQSYVELLLRLCQFPESHRTIHFHDTHASLPITHILSPHLRKIVAATVRLFRSGNSMSVERDRRTWTRKGVEGYSEDIISFGM